MSCEPSQSGTDKMWKSLLTLGQVLGGNIWKTPSTSQGEIMQKFPYHWSNDAIRHSSRGYSAAWTFIHSGTHYFLLLSSKALELSLHVWTLWPPIGSHVNKPKTKKNKKTKKNSLKCKFSNITNIPKGSFVRTTQKKSRRSLKTLRFVGATLFWNVWSHRVPCQPRRPEWQLPLSWLCLNSLVQTFHQSTIKWRHPICVIFLTRITQTDTDTEPKLKKNIKNWIL